MEQPQSALLRLPAEIRLEIYDYYVSQVHGYVHDPKNGKLHTLDRNTSDRRRLDNALFSTCRKIAYEMRGMALQQNKVTFRTQLSPSTAMKTVSDAELFQDLLGQKHWSLRTMLGFANSLVTPQVLQALADKWPGSKTVEGLTTRVASRGTVGLYTGDAYLRQYASDVDDATLDYIFEDLVDIVATQQGFERLSSIGYTMSHWDRWQLEAGWSDERMLEEFEHDDFATERDNFIEEKTGLPRYTAATRWKILGWKPDLWCIPTTEDLLDAKSFIPASPEATRKHFYSAAAVAIQFLQQLPLTTRLHLRRLVLEEDHPSVAEPYTHARGLIPFCRQNPQLRVVRRANFWRTEIDVMSSGIASGALQILADWIRATKELKYAGMPPESFTLTLHGPTSEASQNLADIVIKIAAWQDANLQVLLEKGTKIIPWINGVCEGFPDLIREVVTRQIPVQFEAEYSSELWDVNHVLQDHAGQWPTTFKEAFSGEVFVEPPEGWVAAMEAYDIGPDHLDPLEEWIEFVDHL